MGIVLSLIAILLLVIGGAGCALLLLPRRPAIGPPELAVLSVVLGSALVAAASFLGSLVLSGYPLRVLVGLVCVAMAAAGVRLGTSVQIGSAAPRCWLLPLLFFGAELGLLVWLGGRYILGWDSLVVWEFKARAAFFNGGGMPLAYYLDIGSRWSHPEYPLLQPLTEAWLFDWAGQADERLVRGLFGLYDAALLAAMYLLGRRLGGSQLNGTLGMVLLLLVPQLIIGTGSTSTAWTDYLLGLLYLLSAGYLVQAVVGRAPELFSLVGALSAALVWTKQEGVFLWFALVLATALFSGRNRIGATASVGLPGFAVLVGWRIFLLALAVPPSSDFLPINLGTLLAHLDRLPELAAWTGQQMADGRAWGLLWLAVAVSVTLPERGKVRQQVLLGMLVVAPLVPDVLTFAFSAWVPYTAHVESALPRLMEQVAPLGVLAVASAVPRLRLGSALALATVVPELR